MLHRAADRRIRRDEGDVDRMAAHHVVRDVEQTADHRSAIVAEPAAADTEDRQQDEWQHAPGIPAHPDGDLVQNVANPVQ
jgi:hypothetical protein